METTLILVEAEGCSHRNQSIVIYDVPIMEEIIKAYSIAYCNDALKADQVHIGKRCVELVQILVKSALDVQIETCCGIAKSVQEIIRMYHFDTIYDRYMDILYFGLKQAYPDREKEKYGFLMSTCFNYAFKIYLGKDILKKIKKVKKPSHEIHKYIEDPIIRNRCIHFILFLGHYLATEKCSIQDAKVKAEEMVDKLIQAKIPGLVHPTHHQALFDFMEEQTSGECFISQIQANYYGEVKFGEQVIGDGYVLEDGTCGLSERGLANLVGIDHMALLKIAQNGLSKNLQKFLKPSEKLESLDVKVVAPNSPHLGRMVRFYPVASMELFLRIYSTAWVSGALQKNQMHIGKNCARVQTNLIHFVLERLICEACGITCKVVQKMETSYRKGLFSRERKLLMASTKIQCPKLDNKKAQALVAKSFSFGYKDVFTEAQYKSLQKNTYPLHQHIQDVKLRKKLSFYLFLLSGEMIKDNLSLNKARTNAKALFDLMNQSII